MNKLAIPRLKHFIAMMKGNKYPNHPRLVKEMQKQDIAGAYSISQKTLQRDVAFLRGDYGAPIEYDYQNRGYYLADPSWSWDIPQLNDKELETVIIAAHLAESIMPSPFETRVKEAVDSFMSVSEMPSNVSKILLTLVARGAGIPIKTEIFETVLNGWLSRRLLIVNYTRGMDGKSAILTVEPQVLAFHEGCWYLRVKMQHSTNPAFTEKDVITIAVHRITNVKMTSIGFELDDALVSSAQGCHIFDFPLISKVKLHLSGKGLRFALERFQPEIERRLADGSVIANISKIEEYKVVNFVFAWPGDVCILGPDYLRKHVAEITKIILQKHINDESDLNDKTGEE